MNATESKPRCEYWRDEGRDLLLMRCECWRSMNMNGIADNNGWFPPDRYPHAPYCDARKV